jgi:hypothetical protein
MFKPWPHAENKVFFLEATAKAGFVAFSWTSMGILSSGQTSLAENT